jgi:hypothetical protein
VAVPSLEKIGVRSGPCSGSVRAKISSPGTQTGGPTDRDELVIADHEADPHILAHIQVADRDDHD